MIFSKQYYQDSLNEIGSYYQKILCVDFVNDIFTPIKVDDEEWKNIENEHETSFSRWIKDFKSGGMSVGLDDFPNNDILAKLDKPTTFSYLKLIKGKFHDVRMEILPIGEGRAYLYVIDLASIGHTRICKSNHDCNGCSLLH